MLMRHWATAAFVAGFVFCLPGVVLASGKNGTNGQEHEQAARENVAQQAVDQLVNAHKRPVLNQTDQSVKKVKQQAGHSVGSVTSHGNAAEHASNQALDHASSRSAVHETVQSAVQNQTAENAVVHKSAVHGSADAKVTVQSPASTIHMDPKRVHVTQRIKKPASVNSKAKLDTVPSYLPKKKKTKPKKQIQSKTISKPETGNLPRKSQPSPLPDPQSFPIAVLTPAAAGISPLSSTRPVKGQGSSGMQGYASYWILPSGHTNAMLSLGTMVLRVSQYRNQWINAPPSPPPRPTSLF